MLWSCSRRLRARSIIFHTVVSSKKQMVKRDATRWAKKHGQGSAPIRMFVNRRLGSSVIRRARVRETSLETARLFILWSRSIRVILISCVQVRYRTTTYEMHGIVICRVAPVTIHLDSAAAMVFCRSCNTPTESLICSINNVVISCVRALLVVIIFATRNWTIRL